MLAVCYFLLLLAPLEEIDVYRHLDQGDATVLRTLTPPELCKAIRKGRNYKSSRPLSNRRDLLDIQGRKTDLYLEVQGQLTQPGDATDPVPAWPFNANPPKKQKGCPPH